MELPDRFAASLARSRHAGKIEDRPAEGTPVAADGVEKQKWGEE